jgi:hypothetical protein
MTLLEALERAQEGGFTMALNAAACDAYGGSLHSNGITVNITGVVYQQLGGASIDGQEVDVVIMKGKK